MDSPSDTSAYSSLLGQSLLLQLPAELRFQIYDHLGPWEPKSYPFGRLIISSIDRRAPPTALMATCRYLHDDILTHFYNTVTFRTVAQTIPGVWSSYADPVITLALRRVKKMDLRLHWDDRYKWRSAQGQYPNHGYLDDMTLFLRREAKSLQTMTVSLTDLTSCVDCEDSRRMILSLKELVPLAVLCLGEVIAADGEKEAEIRKRLQQYLEALNEGRSLCSEL